MRAQLIADGRCRPYLILNSVDESKFFFLFQNSFLVLGSREVASNKQDEPLNFLMAPPSAILLQKLLSHLNYLGRGEVLVTLALPHLDTVSVGPVSQQVNTELRLTTRPVNFTRSYGSFRIKEVSAQVLEDILVKAVKWRELTRHNSGFHLSYRSSIIASLSLPRPQEVREALSGPRGANSYCLVARRSLQPLSSSLRKYRVAVRLR